MTSDRVERLRQRFDEKHTNVTETTPQETVKDRPSVLMYLPADLKDELDIRFDELNARAQREHGARLEKNRDYYPAVVRSGLTGESLEDLLEL